ncbi:MAG: hypothetical protein E3K38_14040 [Candidatus Kuenenia stuttgartiensis]|nr:hypothetical protein [Candidatus Kuenenia stuttgartiensis]
MRVCIKYLSLFILLFIQLHFVKVASSQSGDVGSQWKAMPLRSPAQYETGLGGGEGYQMVQGICYAPSNPNVAYLCVDTTNVWKSADGGNSWESKRIGFRSEGARSVCVDPLNENVVFAAGMLPTGGSPVDGIYRTLDGGDTWELVKQTYYSKMIDGVKHSPGEGQLYAFDPNSFDGTRHQTIYAGTHEEGVMKSTDGGDTWATIGLNGKRVSDIELVSKDDFTNILYVATNYTASSGKGLYKITDNGFGTPTVAAVGNLPDYPRTIAVNSSDINNVIIYAAVGTSGAYKSTNGGSSFTGLNTGSAASGKEHVIIEISPADPNRLYIGLNKTGIKNPLYTTNGGTSWQQPSDLDYGDMATKGSGGSTYWGMPIAPHPTDSSVVLSYLTYTLMKTSDGGANWSYSGSGYTGARRSTNKTSAYFDKNDPNRIIYFLIDHGPAITLDGGSTWKMIDVPRNGAETTPVGTGHPDNPNIIITAVGTWGSQHIVRSVDAGQTWTKFLDTVGNYQYMSVHPQDSNCVYAGSEGGSWRSNNAGESWTYISDHCIRTMYSGDGDIIYASEKRTSDTIFWYSSDRGTTWSESGTLPSRSVYDVDIDPLNPNVLYAACSSGLYVFDGADWYEIGKTNGLPIEIFGETQSFIPYNVVVDTKDSNTIYVGIAAPGLGKREQYIFKSTDSGNTWKDIRYNMSGYSRTWGLSIDPNRGDLHMCISNGNYVLSYQSLVVDIVSPSDGATVNTNPVDVAYTVDGGSQKTVSKSLTEGTNTVSITETDSAGNTGSASITVTLDTTAPVVKIVSPADGTVVNASPVDVTYTVDGGSQKTVSKSLTEGTNTVSITETDSAGNTGSASIIVTLNTLITATNSKTACYTFDEGSGTVATDKSGNGNNGTVNGAVFSSGKSGTGLSFDGADDYVSIPSMNYDEISVTAWFYKNQNDTTNADAIFGGWKWNSDIQKNEGFDIRFYKTTPDTIDFCLVTEDTSGTRTRMTASNNLGDSTGAWYHVACTYNQSTGEQKLYINGALVKTENHPAGNKITPLSTYSDMRIGHSRVNKGYFNGKIDEVCIYNHALSDQEVQNLYNSN